MNVRGGGSKVAYFPKFWHTTVVQLLTQILPYIQIGLSVVLIALILLQQSSAGVGGAFGGGDGSATFHTKRGLEKVLFIACIIVSILFVLSTVAAFLLSK